MRPVHGGPTRLTESTLISRRYLGPVLLALLLMLLSACSPPPEPPARLALNPWIGYDPFIMARENGLVPREALRVVEMMSYSETLRAFRNGQAEAAAMTLDDALVLADQGIDLEILLILSESNGADALLAQPAITSISELQNKRIGYEDTAISRLLLNAMLNTAGMETSDVIVVHTEVHMHRQTLRSGQLDAVITFEPVLSRLAGEGFVKLFDSSLLPGQIIDVVVIRRGLSRMQRDAIIDSWYKGLDSIRAHPEETAAILAPPLDLIPQAYLTALQGIRFVERQDAVSRMRPDQMLAAHGQLVAQLQSLNLIRHPPEWARILATHTPSSRQF